MLIIRLYLDIFEKLRLKFGWVGFMAYQPLQVIKCQNPLYPYYKRFVNAKFVSNIFKRARANLFAYGYTYDL